MNKSILTAMLVISGAGTTSVFAQEPRAETDVFASRGDGVVTHELFDTRVSRIPEEHRLSVLRDRKRLGDILNDLLLKMQLAAAAREAGLDQDPLVQARMRLAAEEELADAWLQGIPALKGEPDFEKMAHEYYLANEGQFKTEPTIDVTHILVGTEEREEAEARVLADELRGQLDENPEAFDALVREHSDDPSASANRGRFRNVKKGDMVKAFEDVAFNLEAGQISMPVKTQYGFHIIRLDQVNPPRDQDFEEVKDALMLRMQRRHTERVKNDYLNELSTVPTVLPQEELEAMVERYFGESLGWQSTADPGSE